VLDNPTRFSTCKTYRGRFLGERSLQKAMAERSLQKAKNPEIPVERFPLHTLKPVETFRVSTGFHEVETRVSVWKGFPHRGNFSLPCGSNVETLPCAQLIPVGGAIVTSHINFSSQCSYFGYMAFYRARILFLFLGKLELHRDEPLHHPPLDRKHYRGPDFHLAN